MKKMIFFLLAISLFMAIGATSFATTSFDKVVLTDITKGHVDSDGLAVPITEDFAYCNPFAQFKEVELKKAILEGDGDPTKLAEGYIKFDLYVNFKAKVVATASKFIAQNTQNHPNNIHEGTQKFELPVKVSWTQGSWAGKSSSEGSTKNYDCWSYLGEKVYFAVSPIPVDGPFPGTPISIDDVHAGNYRGTITLTVTQDTSSPEGGFAVHPSCPFGYNN